MKGYCCQSHCLSRHCNGCRSCRKAAPHNWLSQLYVNYPCRNHSGKTVGIELALRVQLRSKRDPQAFFLLVWVSLIGAMSNR